MTELVRKAFSEISKLPENQQDKLAAWILERLAEESQAEVAWEEAVLNESLGNALNSDGSIDFEKLRTIGTNMTLREFATKDHEGNEP